jgi:Uma2 family endonuclease
MSTQIEPLLTIDDVDAMPEDGTRYEVIEGELFVSRAPGLTHQRVSLNLALYIGIYLSRNPVGEILAAPGVVFSEFSGVIPDLAFVKTERREEIASGERITGAPDLVIEIVSPGAENERRDRTAKRQLYGKYGVKEYWLVDPYKRTVEVFLLKGRTLKLHAVYADGDKIISSMLPGFTCNVGSIFGPLSLPIEGLD